MSSEVLLDRYQIDSVLAQHEGERSLKALDRQSEQPVFIREYDLGNALNQERIGRFQRQASLLKQLAHPRIPALLDWVQTDSRFILISQFVAGQNLAMRMHAGWKPQEKDGLRIAEQLLQILSYLQRYNPPLLTFDLRPEKLILDHFERIWLADFGGLQPVNELQSLAMTLIRLLTGRELQQLPKVKDKPAFHSFVSISNEFARWLDLLLESSDKRGFGSADKALEMLWKLQGKTWQAPPVPQPGPLAQPTAPEARPLDQGPWPAETRIESQYRLRQFLGKGQGTWKYSGWDTSLKQDVVIKLMPLPAGQAQDASTLAPYAEQARYRQSLHHPQIPRLLRAFTTELDGQPYWAIVSVLIAGQTLKDKFESGWRPASAELWDLTRQILKILAYLHTRQPPRAHGHLNPSNLVVNNFGRVWLIDFSLLPSEPATDLYDLAASLIFLLSGSQPGEFLAGGLKFRFADGASFPVQIETWLRRMLQTDPSQRLTSAAEALAAFDDALLAAQPVKAPEPVLILPGKVRSTPIKAKKTAAGLSWEACVDQLRALGLHSDLLNGGGIELQCPESKELSQWNRSKTIGMLFSPLRLLEESQEKSRQSSKFFPLSGHRLEINPEDIRLLKGETASGDKELLAIYWSQLLQARLTPAPPKLLAALKDKVTPPPGTNFRLFHLLLTNKAQNAHCLLFLPPKSVPPLSQLLRQQLAGST